MIIYIYITKFSINWIYRKKIIHSKFHFKSPTHQRHLSVNYVWMLSRGFMHYLLWFGAFLYPRGPIYALKIDLLQTGMTGSFFEKTSLRACGATSLWWRIVHFSENICIMHHMIISQHGPRWFRLRLPCVFVRTSKKPLCRKKHEKLKLKMFIWSFFIIHSNYHTFEGWKTWMKRLVSKSFWKVERYSGEKSQD